MVEHVTHFALVCPACGFKNLIQKYLYDSKCIFGINNYLKYLKSGTNVTYKKYLYAMRSLINARYIVKFNRLPDINFINVLRYSYF